MSNNKTNMLLRYKGAAVENGAMDAYKTAASIFAFSDFLKKSGHLYFGDSTKMNIEVKAFQQGSFIIDFGFGLFSSIAGLFTQGYSIENFIAVIKNIFEYYEFTKGETPTSVTNISGDQVEVKNKDGSVRFFNRCTFNIVTDTDANKALNAFLVEPLSTKGIDSAELTSGAGEIIAEVDDINKGYFSIPDIEKVESSNTVQKVLFIESPNLIKSENKWKMNDGSQSFPVSIEDQDFLDQVNNGQVRFGKGDRLVVSMREEQVRTGDSYTTKRTILKVEALKEGFSQSDMFP